MAEETQGSDAGHGSPTATQTDTTQQTTAPADALLGSSDRNLLDWRSSFPENLRLDPTVQKYRTPDEAAKALVSQQEMLGRALFLPRAEPGTDEYLSGMQKVYERLGRPDTADKYEFTAPEGKTLEPEIQKRFGAAFHKAGLSQEQAAEVVAEYWRSVDYAAQVRAGQEARSYEEGRKALYAEFGAATENVQQGAKRFFDHFGAGAFGGEAGEKAWEQIMEARLEDGSRLANSPYILAAFHEAGKRIGEGEFYDTPFYQAGLNSLDTINKREAELLDKEMKGEVLSAQERAEQQQIYQQLSRLRQRGQRV